MSQYIDMIESMSQMSAKDVDNEIANFVEDIVNKNATNKNIIWDSNFVDDYVKIYSPESIQKIDRMSTTEDLSEDDELFAQSGFDTQLLVASPKTKTAVATIDAENVAGEILYTLKITTKFGYDGTDVLSLYPKTTATVTGFAWSYTGLKSSDCYEKIVSTTSGDKGLIRKHGLFKMKVVGTVGNIIIDQTVLGTGKNYYEGETY